MIMFKLGPQQRRQTLGRNPVMSLEEARTTARAALADVRRGIDPTVRKAEEAREAQARRTRTVAAAIEDFLRLHSRYRASTRVEVARLFKREVVPVIGTLPIADVTRRDVAGVINAVVDRGSPATANRLYAYLQSFFGWLVMRAELETRPIANLAKPGPERTRDRVLTAGELAAVWEAAGSMGAPFGALVQILILTAQRRGEVANMLYAAVDEAAALWTLPREATKNDRAHAVPLSPAALRVLASIKREESPLVFPAEWHRHASNTADRPISGWTSYKRQLDTKALALLQAEQAKGPRPEDVVTLPAWTLHDLRRTAASGMAAAGVAPHVVERLLNHSTGTIRGVAAVYNRHSYADEMRAAAELWAKLVDAGLPEKC